MQQNDIDKAFEGRWRFKGKSMPDEVKTLCRDFFTAGAMLAQTSSSVMAAEYPTSNDEAFEAFWDAYDKKIGRPKCEKLWAKLTFAEKKACLCYIPLYKQAQPDKQYRKNPETFLRNKSWNDEIIIRDQSSQRKQQLVAEATELIARYTAADRRNQD